MGEAIILFPGHKKQKKIEVEQVLYKMSPKSKPRGQVRY